MLTPNRSRLRLWPVSNGFVLVVDQWDPEKQSWIEDDGSAWVFQDADVLMAAVREQIMGVNQERD